MHESLNRLQELADYVNNLETDKTIRSKALDDSADIIINALTIIRTIEDVVKDPDSTKESIHNMMTHVRSAMDDKTVEIYDSEMFQQHIDQIDEEYKAQEADFLRLFTEMFEEAGLATMVPEEDRDEDGYTEDENDEIEALLDDIRVSLKESGLRASDVGGFKFASADEFNSTKGL